MNSTIQRIIHAIAQDESDLAAVLHEIAFALGAVGRYSEMIIIKAAAEEIQLKIIK